MNAELEKAIQEAITQGTFSLEAIKGLQALRKELEITKEELEQARKAENELRQKVHAAGEEKSRLSARLVGQDVMDAREKACLELETENKYEKRRGNEMYVLLQQSITALKMRTSSSGSVPIRNNYGGIEQHAMTQDTVTKMED